jgi:hypothetical protein
MFNCASVDPDGVDPSLPLYLRRDYSIACDSDRYRVGQGWAIAMIFVYPVGLLSLYFYVLWHNRLAISHHTAKLLAQVRIPPTHLAS